MTAVTLEAEAHLPVLTSEPVQMLLLGLFRLCHSYDLTHRNSTPRDP